MFYRLRLCRRHDQNGDLAAFGGLECRELLFERIALLGIECIGEISDARLERRHLNFSVRAANQ